VPFNNNKLLKATVKLSNNFRCFHRVLPQPWTDTLNFHFTVADFRKTKLFKRKLSPIMQKRFLQTLIYSLRLARRSGISNILLVACTSNTRPATWNLKYPISLPYINLKKNTLQEPVVKKDIYHFCFDPLKFFCCGRNTFSTWDLWERIRHCAFLLQTIIKYAHSSGFDARFPKAPTVERSAYIFSIENTITDINADRCEAATPSRIPKICHQKLNSIFKSNWTTIGTYSNRMSGFLFSRQSGISNPALNVWAYCCSLTSAKILLIKLCETN
jgi:hypothetical protein